MKLPQSDPSSLKATRASPDELTRQATLVSGTPLMNELLDAVPEIIAILNADRQIVFANQALASYFGLGDLNRIYGLRIGEAFNCVHAFETNAGCNTSEFCTHCGAANSILAAQAGNRDVRECHIGRCDGSALDFRVAASPLTLGGERYTVFCLTDISGENQRRALVERIFFHDVLNTATSVNGAAELLTDAANGQKRELSEMVRRLSKRLISEIQAQRELATAEAGELVPRNEICYPAELVNEVAAQYRSHKVARGRQVVVEVPEQTAEFQTDSTLLGQVLGNMVKNALEAVSTGETVKIGFDVESDGIHFRVWNPGVMPRPIQLQLFQRSFTTKGPGHGLGTYSMKLLGEKYLGGEVSFSSHEDRGTTFHIRLPRKAQETELSVE